jgi:predicted dehydrogenase
VINVEKFSRFYTAFYEAVKGFIEDNRIDDMMLTRSRYYLYNQKYKPSAVFSYPESYETLHEEKRLYELDWNLQVVGKKEFAAIMEGVIIGKSTFEEPCENDTDDPFHPNYRQTAFKYTTGEFLYPYLPDRGKYKFKGVKSYQFEQEKQNAYYELDKPCVFWIITQTRDDTVEPKKWYPIQYQLYVYKPELDYLAQYRTGGEVHD